MHTQTETRTHRHILTYTTTHTHLHTRSLSLSDSQLNIDVKSWLTIYAPPSVFAQFAFCNIYCKLVLPANTVIVVTLPRFPTPPQFIEYLWKFACWLNRWAKNNFWSKCNCGSLVLLCSRRACEIELYKCTLRSQLLPCSLSFFLLLSLSLSQAFAVLVSILFLSISAHCTAIKIDLCRRDWAPAPAPGTVKCTSPSGHISLGRESSRHLTFAFSLSHGRTRFTHTHALENWAYYLSANFSLWAVAVNGFSLVANYMALFIFITRPKANVFRFLCVFLWQFTF